MSWLINKAFLLLHSKNLKRYLIIGILAYLIEMATLYFFRHILDFGPVLSVAISFWVGFLVAFILQKIVVFQNLDKRRHIVAKQMVGYSLLVLWNYTFTLIAIKILSPNLSVFIVRTAAIAVITIWNFAIYHVIFRQAI